MLLNIHGAVDARDTLVASLAAATGNQLNAHGIVRNALDTQIALSLKFNADLPQVVGAKAINEFDR
ncbi:hypothetical protein GCM10010981_09780 [Dyella nitratireducens]|uniref:Uncharacterized protein n=2 Tax=Dyella nitratireducens TaxID=1849580 RepID=A0ABQ1FN27_9GAMM|nr:hypothetical protein GCM10010981_09780 [Dyella nitratireducens]GLQ43959.1 hypothetical protein GCM10007902_38090 [Dyella nitratireducens]